MTYRHRGRSGPATSTWEIAVGLGLFAVAVVIAIVMLWMVVWVMEAMR